MLSNLLNNAAKYSDRGGHIWLIAKQRGSQAVVTVRDTGMGIPAELLSHIFEMFRQGHRSLERFQSGLGIGLSLAKQIVERHGGTVTAYSDGPGTGSTFIVRLPVLSEPQPVAPPCEPGASTNSASGLAAHSGHGRRADLGDQLGGAAADRGP
jgi:signal transduction histidine kinase